MTRFSEARTEEPFDQQWDVAHSVCARVLAGALPANRMEAGLSLAARVHAPDRDSVAERGLERAFAHALARGSASGDGMPSLSSVDWARTLLVDASMQREAATTLTSSAPSRASRHRWGAVEAKDEAWTQAGVPPTMFSNASEDALKAMASGSAHELEGDVAARWEVAVTAAMAPGLPGLEHRLETLLMGPGVHGREAVEAFDRSAHGDRERGPDSVAMGAIADRMDLARRAAQVGHRDARGLFDPTPGRNPFEVDFDQTRRAQRAVSGVDPSPFGRVVLAASRSIDSLDLGFDVDGAHRLATAAARLLATGADPSGDGKGDVRRLMADVLLQRSAEDALDGRESPSHRILETMVSGDPDAREAVGFTRLRSEAGETKAVADGRFDLVGDDRGIASGLRNAVWRAGIVGTASIDRIVRREMDALAPTGRPVSVARGPEAEHPAVAMAALARGGAGR